MGKIVTKKCTRAYQLMAFSNGVKGETVRYTHAKFLEYANFWIGRLFFSLKDSKFSTAGMGAIANKALHKAKGII